MNLEKILPNNDKSNTIIKKDMDPDKYESIARRLCEKRKALETQLKTLENSSTDYQEFLIDFERLKESMKTFGVSEIDYHAYHARQERVLTSTSAKPKGQEPFRNQTTFFEPD